MIMPISQRSRSYQSVESLCASQTEGEGRELFQGGCPAVHATCVSYPQAWEGFVGKAKDTAVVKEES